MENQIKFGSIIPLDFLPDEVRDFNLQAEIEFEERSETSSLSLRSKRISKRRSRYQKIDNTIRQKLIDAVIKDGQMLKTAAGECGVNYSSAKSIFHTYRKEGRISKKSLRDRYLKKHCAVPKPKLMPLPSINISESESSLSDLNSFKQKAYAIFNGNNKEGYSPSSQLTRVVDLKASQQQSFKIKPKLPYYEDSLPKLIQTTYQNQYGFNSPTFYNFNPTPNMIHQINNINMYQELARVHGIISNNLPLTLGKPVVYSNTLLDNFSALVQLQAQQRNNSLLKNAKLF